MIRLVGNPNPVVTSEFFADSGLGFNDEVVGEFEKIKDDQPWMYDIDRICRAFHNHGFLLDAVAAYYAWSEFSSSLRAHWMRVHDDDVWIIHRAMPYLSEA